jgi:periplasmic protein TonB
MNKHLRVYLPRIIGGLIFIVAIAYVVKIIGRFIDEQPVKHEKKIQPVTILKPPPPPPPPPKVEKLPEPEVEKKIEELEQAEPEPEPLPDVPDQKPEADTGLDAEGTAGSDAFGLVGRKGGRGLLGGGGGSPYLWYAGTIKGSLEDIFSGHDELRKKKYSAVVKIWLSPDGSVTRYELARGSNDPDIDELLNKLLAEFRKANEAPPVGMPQPVKLKISTRF